MLKKSIRKEKNQLLADIRDMNQKQNQNMQDMINNKKAIDKVQVVMEDTINLLQDIMMKYPELTRSKKDSKNTSRTSRKKKGSTNTMSQFKEKKIIREETITGPPKKELSIDHFQTTEENTDFKFI